MKVLGFAGWSGSGKTTLLEQVIVELRRRGYVISLIKHAHHDFDIDHPGKDSWRHRHAGCQEVLITSGRRWALMHELRDEAEPGLEESLARLAPCDLVLVEGFKYQAIPKIEVYRPALGKPPRFAEDPHIIAVATDAPVACAVPRLDLNQPLAVVEFVVARFLAA